jgi:DNA-binding PadR family transcriptional regulator
VTKRKPGYLFPLEAELLGIALRLARTRAPELHGFRAAQELGSQGKGGALTANGTVYKALARLEEFGLLESRWEDAEVAVAEGRPRRRLYRITEAGRHAALPARLGRRAMGRGRPGS